MNLEEINLKIREKERELKDWTRRLKIRNGEIRSKGKNRTYTCTVCGNTEPCIVIVPDDDMFMPRLCFNPIKKAIWLRKEE